MLHRLNHRTQQLQSCFFIASFIASLVPEEFIIIPFRSQKCSKVTFSCNHKYQRSSSSHGWSQGVHKVIVLCKSVSQEGIKRTVNKTTAWKDGQRTLKEGVNLSCVVQIT